MSDDAARRPTDPASGRAGAVPLPETHAGPAAPGAAPTDDMRARWSFLAEASDHLADSLDYETTLRTVAGLSLPLLGSWSIVDLCDADGTVRRLAIVHHDPEMQKLARQLEEGWPPQRDDPVGAASVVRTGTSELIARVPDDLLEKVARGPENRRLLGSLGIASLMTVPMRARGRILGAMTFLSSSPDRIFTESDLSLAEDLGRRCAVSIENARLHRDALALAESEAGRLRAEAADEVKAEFLSMLNHELRTPLNGIAGYLELLAMEVAGPLTSRQREYVDRIQAGERQMLRMVEDMLNFIRLYSQEIQYETVDFPLCQVVEDAAGAYRPTLEGKGLALRIDCPAEVRASADPAKVWQVLFNLLSNARKFTEPGGEVAVESAPSGENVVLRVRDTGCGIEPRKLGKIFDPFVQGDPALSRRAEGIGLGLAISRQLARGMGGDLTAETVSGEGSTFTLTLPAARA
jgi:signal transduction histidine kinase